MISLIVFAKASDRLRKNIIIVVAIVLIADFVSSKIMKNIFQRVRPCHVIDDVRLLVGCSSSFSFPSSHATNIVAFSYTISCFYSKFKYIFLIIALIICYTRVYVGVHYPFDCVFGAVLGISVSFIFTGYLQPGIEKLYEARISGVDV